jgi:A nuclease family of the HNH/ENDO VII superfamily with conserved AHH
VGTAINSASSAVRNFSEGYIGDTATTVLGGVLQAGVEIAGVTTGLRGLQSAVGDVAFALPNANVLYSSVGGIPIKASYIAPSLIGDGATLAKALGGVPEGYQAHHLVMSSIAKDSPALQHLAKQGLYDVNRAGNGLALPGSEFLALADDLPLHRGFHGSSYRVLVDSELKPLNNAFERGVSDAALMRQVGRIEANIQQQLLSGNVYLNAADTALRRGK